MLDHGISIAHRHQKGLRVFAKLAERGHSDSKHLGVLGLWHVGSNLGQVCTDAVMIGVVYVLHKLPDPPNLRKEVDGLSLGIVPAESKIWILSGLEGLNWGGHAKILPESLKTRSPTRVHMHHYNKRDSVDSRNEKRNKRFEDCGEQRISRRGLAVRQLALLCISEPFVILLCELT